MRIFYIICLLFLLSCSNKDPHQKISYHKNGKLKSITTYNDEKKSGPCYWFYENGKLEQFFTYYKGVVEGHAYLFYKSGALKNHKIYKNDLPVGYSYDYYDHSIEMIQMITIFNEEGSLISRKIYDTLGNIIKSEGDTNYSHEMKSP